MQDQVSNLSVRDIALPLYNAKFWMKLVGIVQIIQGILVVLGTFGIGLIFAWLPIWLGVLLFQSANAIQTAYESGDADSMAKSLDKLKLFFVIIGVVTLVSILLGILIFIFFGSMLGGMIAQMPQLHGM